MIVPFTPALAPWIDQAGRVLDRVEVGSAFAPPARADLEDRLARELSNAAAATLLEGFLQCPGRTSMSSRSRRDYDRYVSHLAAGGMRHVLDEHPVLATVLDTVVRVWSERVGRLAADLLADAPLVRHHFGATLPIERAISIGEAVTGLRSTNGTNFIHKARSLDMEVAWGRLLTVVNRRLDDYHLATPITLDCGDHGWAAHVEHRPPTEQTAAHSYWYRTGRLLCLVHAIGGGDIHAGNLRVADQHPVIIDGEVLLRPRRAGVDDDHGNGDDRDADGLRGQGLAVADKAGPDVVATGWLPTPSETERCGLVAIPHDVRSQRWVDPGTDGMRHQTLRSPLRGIRAEVVKHLEQLRTGSGIDALCTGFTATYQLLLDHGLPLDGFAGTRPRVLLRSSHLYQDAVEEARRPRSLISPSSHVAPLDRLAANTPLIVASASNAELAEEVAAAEKEAMADGEVPRFTMPANGHTLWHRGRLLGDAVTRSPLERATAFLDQLSPDACQEQLERIHETVSAAIDPSQTTWGWQLQASGPLQLDQSAA